MSGGSTDDGDHGSQHLLLQQSLAQQRVGALCRQWEERDALEPAAQSGEAGTALNLHQPWGRAAGPGSPGAAGSPFFCSSPAPTLRSSLHGHGQQAGHHGPVVVPAAFCILLALQGHVVQALAHGDHILGVPGLTPCGAQSPLHQIATAPTRLIWPGSRGHAALPTPPPAVGFTTQPRAPRPTAIPTLSQSSPAPEAAPAQTCSTELPAVGCVTFLRLPEMLQQDRDSLPHDAGVGGHGCQGPQAALLQEAAVTGALLLPL